MYFSDTTLLIIMALSLLAGFGIGFIAACIVVSENLGKDIREMIEK